MDAPARAPLTPLALTMGDPAGIGPEIALLAWRDRQRRALPPFAVYADLDLMRDRAALIAAPVPIEPVPNAKTGASCFTEALPVVAIPLARPARPGVPDAENAGATLLSIRRAVADVAADKAAAVVTNPIAKSVLYQAGFSHPGHTEFLGALAREYWPGEAAEPVMMLAGPDLRVVPVTIHVALKEVPGLLTTVRIMATARIVANALKRDFGIEAPRLAVSGLNPHAGEDGALGTEDQEVVRPAVEALRAEGFDIRGPLSADTMFHAAARKTYDAAIAMYHDQALIPIKTLAFDEGVNITLGLPFVRTSPDHGTAFAIAGRGVASPASLEAALKLAAEMSARRLGATAP